jgi:hypothetical protein
VDRRPLNVRGGDRDRDQKHDQPDEQENRIWQCVAEPLNGVERATTAR